MRSLSASVLLVASTLVHAPIAAQEITPRENPLLLERSYIFGRVPVHDLAFEAQIAPHLYLRRPDIWGMFRDSSVYVKPVVSWTVALTPMVRLRMLSTPSNPVRTPSYMPRPLGDWQLFRASVADTAWDARRFGEVPLRVWALTLLPWAHHSNGQDGCLYTYQSHDADGNCIGSTPIGSIPTTNELDGSFTTNFVSLAVGYSYVQIPYSGGESLEARDRCTFRIGAEYHPPGYLIGGIRPEQGEYYPHWQLFAGAEWAGVDGRLLVAADARLMRDPVPVPGTAAYQVEVSWLPHRFSGWGFFTRFYSGMDYYNLGFLDSIQYLQLGLVWDAGSIPRLQLPTMMDAGRPTRYEQNRLLDGGLSAPFDWLCNALH